MSSLDSQSVGKESVEANVASVRTIPGIVLELSASFVKM